MAHDISERSEEDDGVLTPVQSRQIRLAHKHSALVTIQAGSVLRDVALNSCRPPIAQT